MSDINRAVREANEFADRAIRDAKKSKFMDSFTGIGGILLRNAEIVVFGTLLGWFVCYELGVYING